MSHKVYIVNDLGFGDSGKGKITHALTAKHGAKLVVRYNGGAQAAHTVIDTKGRTHTSRQFGSGTFEDGVDTYLSRFMLFNPVALYWEAKALERLGVSNPLGRIYVHENALVTTPYHIIANQLKETFRGDSRHGSCGMGIGETMQDAIFNDFEMMVKHLQNEGLIRPALNTHRCMKQGQLEHTISELIKTSAPGTRALIGRLYSDTERDAAVEVFSYVAKRINVVGDDFLGERLSQPGCTVFEGAQGVLLDADHGFAPYTTWSKTTPHNAHALLGEADYNGSLETIGVIRAYQTRHGAGPFPTEDSALTAKLQDEHNPANQWQGAFRAGWLDLPLLRYAISKAETIDSLAVTCLDRIPQDGDWKVCFNYGAADTIGELPVNPTPFYRDAPRDYEHYTQYVSEQLGIPLSVKSFGASVNDTAFLDAE